MVLHGRCCCCFWCWINDFFHFFLVLFGCFLKINFAQRSVGRKWLGESRPTMCVDTRKCVWICVSCLIVQESVVFSLLCGCCFCSNVRSDLKISDSWSAKQHVLENVIISRGKSHKFVLRNFERKIFLSWSPLCALSIQSRLAEPCFLWTRSLSVSIVGLQSMTMLRQLRTAKKENERQRNERA